MVVITMFYHLDNVYMRLYISIENDYATMRLYISIENDYYKNEVLKVVLCFTGLWPLLLTWFNFNPSMDK